MASSKKQMAGAAESDARRRLAAAQERAIGDVAIEVRPRYVEVDGRLRLQILEAGDGDPVVMLHGGGANAVTMLPLAEHLRGRRVIIVDRPGYGLSDPVDGLREHPRTTAIDVLFRLLDVLGLDRVDLVGSSGGGVWSLWAALDRPERVRRIVLVGATPLLPGTRPTVPLRLITTPVIGNLLERILPDPSPDTVKRFMGMMGEGESIGRYPAMVDALAAGANDPIAGRAQREELTAFIRGVLGFRPSLQFTETELRRLRQPALLIWGSRDPVGSPDAARATAKVIPHGRVVEVPTGHVPWLGEPEHTAELITRFLDERA